MEEKNNLLERFIENEKKSKIVTLISTILLIVFALIILFISIKNRNLNEELIVKNEKLKETNAKLEEIRSAQNNSIVALKKYESVIASLKNTNNINEKTKFKKELKKIEENKGKYKIYTHYMPNYLDDSDKIKEFIDKNKNYYVPESELIRGISFNPQIRYFNKEDKLEAENLQRKIKVELGLDLEVKNINIVAQEKQLEIWYGKKESNEKKEKVY